MMANQAGWAALKFKKKFPQVKYLLTLQEGDSEWDIFWRIFLIRPIYKAIYRRADYIQTISNFLKKRAENLGAKCQIEVVPNGVKFSFSPPAGGGVNPPIGGEEGVGEKRIITVSRLVKKNGIEDLIEAFAYLISNIQYPISLTIIGDGKLRKKLEKLARDLKISENVNFLGIKTNYEVYNYLFESDVFVRPSLSEGLGNAFLEAMSVGVPVIATPVGGIPDFLHNGETGWFCKLKDPKSIAEKINWILDDKNKEEVNRVVENARKMVMEKYNWNKIAINMLDIFRKIIDK